MCPRSPMTMAERHLATTTITGTACRHCHALVLTGLAEGLQAWVDPTPLNQAGEIAALIAGRWTYTLTRAGLVHRSHWRIGDTRITGPILAEHRCGHVCPAAHRVITPPPVPVPATNTPPY